MKRYSQDEYCSAPGIPGFMPLLKAWLATLRDYTSATGDDYAWHYHERAFVGFLAAAVWRMGGVALEEWRTDKGPSANPRKGRCDLYLYRRRHYEFQIEAKHMWSRATSRQGTGAIEEKLTRAVTAANDLQCPRKQKIGILFVAPYYPIGKQRGMTEHIATWLESIWSVQHSAIAWLFRDRHSLRPSTRYNFCPGIVLLARTAYDQHS
ncbi:MAG: hypothetical protein ABR514_05750 [Chthoniobacterales bacterium]